MHPVRGINILLSDYIVAKTVPHGKLWRLKTVDSGNDQCRIWIPGTNQIPISRDILVMGKEDMYGAV